MFVNKAGSYHLENGINNQDFGWCEKGQYSKCVLDGCSEGKHSEVGAKLFFNFYSNQKPTRTEVYYLVRHNQILNSTIKEMTRNLLVEDDVGGMLNYMCFTTLICVEHDDEYIVDSVGDGFIVAQTIENEIEIIELKTEIENSPPYLIYNELDPSYLSCYKEGVSIVRHYFPKEKYINVGVATDGLRFIMDKPELLEELKTLLINGKEVPVKLFINRNQKLFQDDITIAF